MEDQLINFMRSRNIDEDIINRMVEEKMDMAAIASAEDGCLKLFIPKYGDRLAIKEYCRKNDSSTRESLIDKLRRKISAKQKAPSEKNNSSNRDCDSGSSKKRRSSTIEKPSRMVEIGWMHSENSQPYTQVRTKQGGGTRRISVNKKSTKEDIIQMALNLFYPGGISTKGEINKYKFDLWDFKSNKIDENLTIDEMFQITKLTTLRFYLASTKKPETVSRPPGTDSENNELHANNTSNTSTIQVNLTENAGMLGNFIFENEHSSYNTELFNVIPTLNIDTFPEDPNLSAYTSNSQETDFLFPIINIKLHRGHVFEELIQAFHDIQINSNIEITVILPNGQQEAGLDVGGVFRDICSEFWECFYNKCTLGTVIKVPYIRHDFDEKKWKTIAKILCKGYKDVNYFPIKLARPFIEYCVFDSTISDITNPFFNYISNCDSEILKKAIEDFDCIDSEEIHEVMQALECKTVITASTIKCIIKDIAHREFIQKPMFIIDCWRSILSNFFSLDELNTVYEIYKITQKNVLKLLEFPTNTTTDMDKVIAFLKKYIREADINTLSLFLRFCTGANVITNNKIVIEFNNSTGLNKVPVAHTCGCLLELPIDYENYPEFRSDFNNLLNSNVWVMDIA